jgi:hypothetical protein
MGNRRRCPSSLNSADRPMVGSRGDTPFAQDYETDREAGKAFG